MFNKIKISNYKKIKELKHVNSFLNPSRVYIPLISQNDRNITLLVKKGDYVFKGSIVAKRKGDFRIPIFSSVSGTVVDFKEHTYLNGEKVKCIEIENDFKEKYETKLIENKVLNKYTKDEFENLLKECGIVGQGGDGFPTYIKYQGDLKTLIVNAVCDEPYVTSDCAIVREKCEEILEAIDAIIDICSLNECFIAVKKDNLELKKIFNNYIGTYLKIHLVEVSSNYSTGWDRNLVKIIKKESYKKLPNEKGIVVNNISTIYSIYEALKYRMPLIQRIVTITGDGVNKPQNVLVKNGTLIKDIIESIGGIKKNKQMKFIAGGAMMGKNLPSDDLVVTSNLTCVLVLKDNSICESYDCIRCGKCVSVCPVSISPVLIKDNIDNIERLKKLKAKRCIECGLCSYICPSKINIREYVKSAKEKIERS